MKLPVAWTLPTGEPLEEWAAKAKEIIDGRPVIVSVSGGKDSTATALLLQAAGIPFTSVHMDTGWEHPWTAEYVRDYLPGVLGPIKILQAEVGGMVDLIRHKGTFPTRRSRFCTQWLKVFPFIAYIESLDDEPVKAIGIRSAESAARSKLKEWDSHAGFDCDVWRPIISWSYDDVIEVHKRFNVQPNPLYLKLGQTRVGCWPCIFSRKKEVRAVADLTPERIDLIEQLEAEVYAAYVARRKAKGEEIKWKEGEVAFFQNPRRRAGCRNDHLPPSVPIRDVVDWSRTSHGGKQAELFAPNYGEEGCMRWGMCDHGSPDDPNAE